MTGRTKAWIVAFAVFASVVVGHSVWVRWVTGP